MILDKLISLTFLICIVNMALHLSIRVDETIGKFFCTVKFYTAVILLLSQQIAVPNGDMLFLGTLAADCPMHY